MKYSRPTSLVTALEELARGGTALAGGTDLVTMRHHGRVDGDAVVDLKGLPELSGVSTTTACWEIGALTTMHAIATSITDPHLLAVADGAALVGAPQTRRRATLGGNVWRASPSADTLPGLLVAGARVRLRSATRSREVPLEDFLLGPGVHAAASDELLEALVIPRRDGASAYQRATQRASLDLATVGVAVWLELDGARCTSASVAVGGAAPTPLIVPEAGNALAGGPLDAERLATAATATVALLSPIDDVRGSAEYRRHAVRVLLERVVHSARRRAESRSA